MIDEARLVAHFIELVRIDSPSGQEQAIGKRVMAMLRSLGATVARDEIGNVLGRLDGAGEPLMLNAHLDTVGPAHNVQPLVEDGIIRTDGSTILGADDKAGVAIILEVITSMRGDGLPHPPLDVLFTVQEEIGLRGAKAFDLSRLRARECIGLDAGMPQGAIDVSAPSQNHLEAVVYGVAAHAGAEPEKGISAIRVAAEAICAMPLGRIDEETTANIGVISGGQATNIIPACVELKGEARSRDQAKLDAQTAAMERALDEAADRHGASVDIQVTRVYDAYRLRPEGPLVALLAAGAAEVGLEPLYVATGGGSDANVFNAGGIQATNIACGMDQVHTTHEQIAVADMVRCAEWLQACLRLRAAGAA